MDFYLQRIDYGKISLIKKEESFLSDKMSRFLHRLFFVSITFHLRNKLTLD